MKNFMLTKLEQSLLKGALRANSKALKWAAYFIYAVLLFSMVSYLYVFFRTGLAGAMGRVIFWIVMVMIFRTISGYQSLIRKIYDPIGT